MMIVIGAAGEVALYLYFECVTSYSIDCYCVASFGYFYLFFTIKYKNKMKIA